MSFSRICCKTEQPGRNWEDFWGNRDIIAPLSPGELFGEAYACAGVSAGVGVQAEEDGAVLFLEVSRLSGVPGGADLLENLLSATARQNLLLNEKLSHVTRRTTRDKLLSYLSREAARQGGTCHSKILRLASTYSCISLW